MEKNLVSANDLSQTCFQTKNKMRALLKDGVRNHVKFSPKIKLHYLGAKTQKQYLDGSISTASNVQVIK
jgi:hypothetical protein